MLQVKLPVVCRIQPQSNLFAVGVEDEATGDSKLTDSPGTYRDFNDDHDDKAGLQSSGKSQGSLDFIQGQGKVREFCIRSGSFHVPVQSQ